MQFRLHNHELTYTTSPTLLSKKSKNTYWFRTMDRSSALFGHCWSYYALHYSCPNAIVHSYSFSTLTFHSNFLSLLLPCLSKWPRLSNPMSSSWTLLSLIFSFDLSLSISLSLSIHALVSHYGCKEDLWCLVTPLTIFSKPNPFTLTTTRPPLTQ